MSGTKSVSQETMSFESKVLNHEERDKSSTDNLLNFANPLASDIEAQNDTFTLKEATSQPDRLHFVEAMRN